MKIGIIAPPLDTVPSIRGNAIYTLVEDIAKNSENFIHVISIASDNLNENHYNSEKKYEIIYLNKKFKKIFFFEKIFGYRLTKKILKSNNLQYLSYFKEAYRILEEKKVDIIMQEEFADMIQFLQIKTPVIIHQHQPTNPNVIDQQYKKIKHTVFVSQTSMELHRPLMKKVNSSFIYNGINFEHFRFDNQIIDKEELLFLYGGRLHPGKGVLPLMKAFKNDLGVKFKLQIIGGTNTHIKGFIEEMQSLEDENIQLLGIKTQKELAEHLALADFLICPSIGTEGLPKIITEAIVMGIPVICSNRGGNLELIKDGVNGIIIEEPINEETILKAVKKAVILRSHLKNEANSRVLDYRENFSTKKMVKRFDDLFTKIKKQTI